MSKPNQITRSDVVALLVAEPKLTDYITQANEILADHEGDNESEEDEFDAAVELVEVVAEELEDFGYDFDRNTVSEDAEDLIRKATHAAALLLVAAARARRHLRPDGG